MYLSIYVYPYVYVYVLSMSVCAFISMYLSIYTYIHTSMTMCLCPFTAITFVSYTHYTPAAERKFPIPPPPRIVGRRRLADLVTDEIRRQRARERERTRTTLSGGCASATRVSEPARSLRRVHRTELLPNALEE